MKISIIGTLNTEIILGPLSNLPAWGSQVCLPEFQARYMGSAPSVALPLGKLGAEAVVIGTLGEDAAGKAVQENLKTHGLGTAGVEVIPKAQTGICVSLYRADGERLYLSSLGAIGELNEAILCEKMWAIIAKSDAVLLSGLFLLGGLGIEGAINCFARLKNEGVCTSLDTGWDTAGWPKRNVEGVRRLLGVTDIFLPNLGEAKAISNGADAKGMAESLAGDGPREVVIKMGRQGAAGLVNGEFAQDAGFPCSVRDTTAAGEAFNAGYLYASTTGLKVKKSLRLANAVASLFLRNGSYPSLKEAVELTEKS